MKRRDASLLCVGAALTVACDAASSAESSTRVPDIEATRPAAALISRADRAIRRYLDACRTAREAPDVVTSDARIEYTLDSPGEFLSLDASSIFASCRSMGAAAAQPEYLWIFPTGESDAVFIQYETPASGETPQARQLALVEMRGERIQRMRNFGAAPELLLAAMHGSVQSELCARLSWNGERFATNSAVIAVQSSHVPGAASVSSP